ncbi:MAG: hypothetical protein LBF80_00315 [Spirochaetaceae bacterium]|jgi:hypothetical protein|nr:hypothetical protein [Spirochaetaceae bacterium]
MSKKIKVMPEYSIYDLEQLHLRKCEYCKGKDGKNKDVYETLEYAVDTIKHLEKERDIYLTLYPCPHGNGYHLTKNNADSEIKERKDRLLQDNDIPLRSSNQSNISWEYEKQDEKDNIIKVEKRFTKKEDPIKRILPNENTELDILEGKVIEIIDKIDIGKHFNVNIENPITANLLKDLLNDTMSQITIYTKTENVNIQNSYTIFIERGILKQNKIIKGMIIRVNLKYKIINKIKIWYSNKIIK